MAIEQSDESVERYLQLYLYRCKYGLSEEEIASRLGFGSPQALYQQLRADKHPVCPICGALRVEEEHCAIPATAKRKARKGGSETSQLPPAENASELIKEVLELMVWEAGMLDQRNERLESGRFVYEWHDKFGFDKEGTLLEVKERGGWSEEAWRRECEVLGDDPNADTIYTTITNDRSFKGASRIPREPLRRLIGAYVLGGGSLEELLAALHPDPASVNRERLRKMVDRLKVENGRIVTLVRGGNPKTGPGPAELTPYEHTTAVYIRHRRQEGATDDRIIEELSYRASRPNAPPAMAPPYPPQNITREELVRLAGLDLD